MINQEILKENGFIFLSERLGKFRDFIKINKNASIDARIVARIFLDSNRVIFYQPLNEDSFTLEKILFDGKIETTEVFEFIYSLIK